jgi:hypothetical protein
MKIAQYDLVNRASPEKTYQKKKKNKSTLASL